MSWTPSATQRWLETFSSRRYADVAPMLSGVSGTELCFMSESQLAKICGPGRGMALFNHVKQARNAAERARKREFERKEKERREGGEGKENKPTGSFPPLLYIPSLKVCLTFILLSTLIALLLTVWSSSLEDLLNTKVETIIAYGSIPVIACGFTYFHIWLALYMTFFPYNYVGLGPQIPGTNVGFPLGWQGIIPFKAEKMARMAVKLMTEQLIDVKEEFSKLDVDRVATEIDGVVLEKLQAVITNTFEKHQADLWALLPSDVRDELVVKGGEAGPVVISKIMTEVKEDILSVFDIEEFVVGFMTANKELLNKVFIQCGWDELCFIRDCGAVLGGLFGFLQMLLWIPLHPDPPDEPMHPGWQSLTVFLGFGLVVGCATNYLALKIIFEPIEPINICGIYTLQGLFLKRQKEISAVYGKITATEVLSARNIIKRTMSERMGALPAKQFERLLHPVFEEDEWKLIVMGGVLGVAIGALQAYFIN
ncbi:hypothetical protein TrRE_jg4312 [Triparma retinervis]|uniref:SAM domain-containing protein n=1 Tax=Triparma retinervis TaxID=2557542 RepID=A0A9W7G511_9STRA|nr:hypothetical protein TrRE_jg4312 [Triparma retinervis]